MWDVEFFETDNGRCPVQEFLDGLSPIKDLPYIEHEIKLLEEHGYKLDMPHCGFLGNDIYELRIKTINGQLRLLYFFFYNKRIVITHGFKKKSIKVPPKEIKRAQDYMVVYYARKENQL
jgi:phage-related protein